MKWVPDVGKCLTMTAAPPGSPAMRLLGCTCPAVPTTPYPRCGLAGQAAEAIATGHCFISA